MNEIKVIFTDCDGVLTDNGIFYSDSGEIMRRFNSLDGHAINIAKDHGINIVIITAQDIRNGESISRRAEDWNVGIIFTYEKGEMVETYLKACEFKKSETLFIGNDITDLEALPFVGSFICPSDAHREVLKQADEITKARGGEGVLREVVDNVCKYIPINPS